MENALRDELAAGAELPDVLAGLAYSIVENYLGRVVTGRAVGERIFFQGGTAFNTAVSAAFERHLGKPDDTPAAPPRRDRGHRHGPHCPRCRRSRPTVALSRIRSGRAALHHDLVCLQGLRQPAARFNKVCIDDARHHPRLFYGGAVAKSTIRPRPDLPEKPGRASPSPPPRREDLFTSPGTGPVRRAPEPCRAGTEPQAGAPWDCPWSFFMHDHCCRTFPACSGNWHFDVRLSGPTDRRIISAGSGATLSETCSSGQGGPGPCAIASGPGLDPPLSAQLRQHGRTGRAFLPRSQGCPLTQSFP